MRLASFILDKRPEWGVVNDDAIAVVSRRIRPRGLSLRQWLLANDSKSVVEKLTLAASTSPLVAIGAVKFLPPLHDATKIICVGLNYRDHIEEMGREIPSKPVIFTRFADSLTGHGEPLISPAVSAQFDYEGELAVVVGVAGYRVTPERAAGMVFGYSAFNDGSIRDYQRHTSQFTPGKNFPHTGSMGPTIVTSNEVPDIARAGIRTVVEAEVVQNSNIAQLVFGIPELIAYVSEWTPLSPGDVIATGTPGGVGDSRKPPLWLTPGSTVTITIDGLDPLTNTARAE